MAAVTCFFLFQGEVLRQVRELVYQCDQTMKAVTVGYFQLQHTVTAPAPVQFQTLCESSRLYEPGLQYMERVKRQPFSSLHHSISMSAVPQNRSASPSFVFEPYNSERYALPGLFHWSFCSGDAALKEERNKIKYVCMRGGTQKFPEFECGM